ncbi:MULTISPECIES: carbonic anhydrase [unclassified Siphonobacter]|uniref:carbonic anhydrase n=1 Tax=unclassified Siphonobacter TaxID=2635712 RepID=UPI000CBDEB38|nr:MULTISPECIES: carbonic anhydrase [unclassified Siphonobacter]MDQ1090180.1 carbonic anhydrase [Siphonobacter sp. SORGH_AS_1065]MDR6197820.1 carbonic anhydrase [Siphonobacter sp. SORGH_AS_0500]PKK37272.1 carbonic anhydrase [Siphonobacter sp. SORGH_AS_0500]
MDISQIFKNNQDWVQKKLSVEPNYFSDLSKGQTPDILYIGCSDSRVTAEELMGIAPGQAFVHRNIANMVPNTDLSAMSVINYAVQHLKVNHIVVCGHYYCGGVQAAMKSQDLGILNPWLRNIRDVYRTHQAELDAIKDEELRYKRLVELNVEEQCINVIKTAEVQKARRERDLTVHGWVFDVHTGKLIDLNIDFIKLLENIMQIYHLDPNEPEKPADKNV